MKNFVSHFSAFFAAAFISLISVSASGQTLSLNDGTVIQSKTNRIGVNIGAINYFDSGQILKNLIGSINPGFEPLLSQQMWVLGAAGTTTTFTEPDKNDNAPANYWAGATFTVVETQSGGPEMGCTGTIATNTAGASPLFTVSSPCAGAFSVGDIITIRKATFPTPESWWEGSKGGMWGTVSGGGQLLSDTTDLCPTCGTQSLNMNASASGSIATAAFYYDSDYSEDLFVLMNGTFQLSFWAKAASGTPALTVSARRTTTGGFNCGNYNPQLTSTWTQYTFTCTASETPSTTPGTAQVVFKTTGGAVYLDNVDFEKTSSSINNPTVLRDEVIQTLQNFYGQAASGPPGMFRYWLAQNAETTDNWTRPDYAHLPTVAGISYYVGPNGAGWRFLSLEDYLVVCQYLNAEPYLEVPVTITPADAANLIEFLASPSNTTYGARRAALGQSDPWTDVFDKIHLSYCNECWNGIFDGQALPYRSSAPNTTFYFDYGSRAKDIFSAMHADSYYVPSSFDLILNAQTAINWSMDSTIQQVHPDTLELNDYLYSTVSDASSDAALWQPAMVEPYVRVSDSADPYNFYQSVHDYQSQSTCGASGTAKCNVSIYEWGQDTLAGSINQTQMDIINAGAGEGIVMALEPLLNLQYYGILPQSLFSLAQYQFVATFNGDTAKLWGTVVDMGGATNNMRPAFLGVSLVNQSIIGPMYSCSISNNVTYNFAGSVNGSNPIPALSGVPTLYAFCFENGNARSVVLINTDLTASHTVSFAGTNPPAGAVTQRQYAPASLDSLNEAHSGSASNQIVATVAIETSSLSSPGSITLPPHSVTALDFTTNGMATAASPTFSPAGGTYTSAQTVAISDATSGATIYYTTDGTTPTTSSSVYSTPITVSATETLSALAVETGYNNSSVATSKYTISAGTLPAPTFSPAGGTYTTAQSVTISEATSGAIIYYTTNGTTPTTSSSVYSTPITVSATETLSALAVETGYTNSSVGSAAYTINAGTLATPAFSPAGGTYTSSQTVTISDATAGTTIHYTTNGATPTTSSAVYSGAITISATENLEAIAVKTGYTNSSVASAAYTINAGTLAAPAFSPAGGTYTNAQTVAISDATSGTTIHYTTNGTTPTTSSAVYSGAISVSATETLEAIAVKTGYTNSSVGSAAYTINAGTLATPAFSPAGGTYTSSQTVTISDATSGTTIHYTTNGTTPTTSSVVYSGAITVSATETLEAIAVKTGYANSSVGSAVYTINTVLPAPTISPAGGTYTTAQWVTISDSMSGSSIYYTTDGSTPSTSSAKYSGAIMVSASKTLKAIAAKSGLANSPTAAAAFTITPALPAPTFTPAGGTYTSAQTVAISDATSGATIYYTTNGSTPTTSSARYSGTITVSTSETLRAIATETGYSTSAAASASYTIEAVTGSKKTPKMKVTPSSSQVSTTQTLAVAVAVMGSAGEPTPTGTVVITSDSYSSATTALNNGNASISISAGELKPGKHTLTVSYTPNGASAATCTSASTEVPITVADATYSLAATEVTVAPGASATSAVTVSSTTDFEGTVTLSCAVTSSPANATDPPSCTTSKSVSLDANKTSASTSVTVNTTSSSSARMLPKPGSGNGWGRVGQGAVLALMVFLGIPARRRKWQAMLCALILIAATGGLAGCGGLVGNQSNLPHVTNPGTTAGTYTITVTGTGNDSAQTTSTTTFTVTVN